ncbi:MAG TPA: hypothetical protein VI911_08875 [Patescibacteria group bacterium]|nr:MAG: hypothetical protein UR43_C0005G0057 [candidate division TM6 bacterium GW2011_GWF2_33_332]HLD91110.1 hypothetical protein [Patescibacteria group bacterium]
MLEHGVSYNGDSGEIVTLKDAISGATKEATVKGCEMILKAQLSFAAISRSINDAAAYGKATKHVVRNLLNSTYKKHEYQCFYGQSGLATISVVDDASAYFDITVAEWAPGIWVGGEKMKLDIYNLTDSAMNTTIIKITKVDIRNKRLYVDMASAVGDNLATLKASKLAGDELVIYEHGAKGNEFMGIYKMLTTTTGNIFGVSTDYSLWTGNVYPVGGALSFEKISDGIADAVAKGLEGKISLFVNPKTWSDLLNEQTAKRLFDESYDVKKYENGSQTIVFHSQNGLIEIISCTYVKEGIAFGLDLESFERVGSSDITFNLPGKNEEMLIVLENQNGIEYRTYCDLAIFCNALGRNIVFTGIVN